MSHSRVASLALAVLLPGAVANAQAPLGTAFTYQGRLVDGATPANGVYDLRFVLFPAASGGTQVGPTITLDDVTVVEGLFTVKPDFGAVFGGSKRFLEIGVRPGASTGAFTILTPRQELAPAPNAIFSAAAPWTGIIGKPAGFADDVDNDLLGGLACASGQVAKFNGTAWACAADADSGGDITAVAAGTGLTGGGTTGSVALAVNPATVQSRVTGTCAAGSSIRTVNQDGTVACQPDGSPGAWNLGGNAGTTPGTQFIGTTDAQPLEVRVAGQRALTLQRVTVGADEGVNVRAGHSVNDVASGVTGATIGGGGRVTNGSPFPNEVSANFGTVAGGSGNTASGNHSTVGGGLANEAGSNVTTVGGGVGNVATGSLATVAGGSSNTASGEGSAVAGGTTNRALGSGATVSGGSANTAGGFASTVPGGFSNSAGGDNSFAAGGRARVRDAAQTGTIGGDRGTFVWADSASADFVSTGPDQFLVRAAGGVGINTATPASALHVNGTATATNVVLTGRLDLPATTSPTVGKLRIGGAPFLHAFGPGNAFLGLLAGDAAPTGANNTGVGGEALRALTTGQFNVAVGWQALRSSSVGSSNTVVGASALANGNGGDNVAVGVDALTTALGNQNVAVGSTTLGSISIGDRNVAVGVAAGILLQSGSNNIYIANVGLPSESNTIRIGNTSGSVHTAAFLAGISGQTSAAGVPVLINTSHKLGTTTSSRRYKQDIVDMGEESDVLRKLRPVAFLYRPEYDETHTRQYGLIAEEVAAIAPDLVVFDADGQPETVRYHFVNAMLLNEVQKLRALVEEQGALLEELEASCRH